MTLHIINKSPLSYSCLRECLPLCQQHNSILFIEDGIVACQCLTEAELDSCDDKGIKLYVLEADLKARGLTNKIIPPFITIDDDGFVALTIRHQSSVSWS